MGIYVYITCFTLHPFDTENVKGVEKGGGGSCHAKQQTVLGDVYLHWYNRSVDTVFSCFFFFPSSPNLSIALKSPDQ